MKHDMILLFQNSQDDMNVDTLPALLTLDKEHAKAILAEIKIRHPYPKATTITIDLSDRGFPKKPEFLPLEKSLAKEFSSPDHIAAIIDIHEKTFTVKITYGYSDHGIWSSESFYNSDINVDRLTCNLLTEEHMTEWLMNDCGDTAYVKKTLGEELFARMLSKMDIEEADLQQDIGDK